MPEDVAAREVLEDARALAATGEWAKLVALVTSLHPADLAELVLDLNEAERADLLDHLPTDIVGQLFEFAEDDELRDLIRGVGVEDLPAVLEEVDDDVVADVIQQLEPARTGRDTRPLSTAATRSPNSSSTATNPPVAS